MARLLFINDEPDLVAVCHEILTDAGHEVVSVIDGWTAAELAVRTRPDLVILDWILNGLTAETVLGGLRREPATSHVPVLLISALVDGAEKARRHGLDGFLHKPFTAEELLQAVDAVLARPEGARP